MAYFLACNLRFPQRPHNSANKSHSICQVLGACLDPSNVYTPIDPHYKGVLFLVTIWQVKRNWRTDHLKILPKSKWQSWDGNSEILTLCLMVFEIHNTFPKEHTSRIKNLLLFVNLSKYHNLYAWNILFSHHGFKYFLFFICLLGHYFFRNSSSN